MSQKDLMLAEVMENTNRRIQEIREIMDWNHLTDIEIESIAIFALLRKSKEWVVYLKA